MEASIKACQAKGVKVLLSLGGAAGLYGFTSNAEGAQFATILWQVRHPASRPCGRRAVGRAASPRHVAPR